MTSEKGVVLERVVKGRIHRTVFKKFYRSKAFYLVELWDRATRLGINCDIKDLFDRFGY